MAVDVAEDTAADQAEASQSWSLADFYRNNGAAWGGADLFLIGDGDVLDHAAQFLAALKFIRLPDGRPAFQTIVIVVPAFEKPPAEFLTALRDIFPDAVRRVRGHPASQDEVVAAFSNVLCKHCADRDSGIAEDDSLAENDERVGLHPLDQFRAFKLLRDGGMSEEDIAARHFVSPAIVKQRLRLASVSPKLHDVYAEDGMTLEQLMAFSVAADHARQEQVWENVSRSGYDEPYQIRRMLTEATVRASDRRARFVGLDTYEQAGGGILRDLFEHDDGGWLQDIALLDRLVTEKLTAEADTIAKESWKWISVAVDSPYGHAGGLRELEGKAADLTAEEQATIDALNAEQAKLELDYQDADELPDEVDQRLGEIEAALMAFEDRFVVYDPADIVRAGVFVSIDTEGRLSVDRGYVRPEDEAPHRIRKPDRASTRRRPRVRRPVLPCSGRRSRSPVTRLKPIRMMRTRQSRCRTGSSSS